MSENKCKACQFFLQHYILNTRKLLRVYCGHCTYGRVRRKKPEDSACEHFSPGTSSEEAYADKEYLSKKLLDYVLGLELLPEIEELPGKTAKHRGRE